MESNAGLSRVQILVYASLLIAISAVLKILFEVYIPLGGFPSLRINLNSIPIILSGILLGPIPGFVVGIISDLVCYIIKPNGPLFFGFTLSSGLTGLIPGLLWYGFKRLNLKHIKCFNLVIAGILLLFLFLSKTLYFNGYSLYYLQDQLNPFIAILFFLLIILFALYPIIGSKILKEKFLVESENLLVIITIEQILNSILLNTLWLTILYGQAWMVLLPARIVTNIFLIPIYTIALAAILKILPTRFKKLALQ